MPLTGPPEADLHTHTIASGHAYSTINEIAAEAARRQLRLIGMTDHGPALPGGGPAQPGEHGQDGRQRCGQSDVR